MRRALVSIVALGCAVLATADAPAATAAKRAAPKLSGTYLVELDEVHSDGHYLGLGVARVTTGATPTIEFGMFATGPETASGTQLEQFVLPYIEQEPVKAGAPLPSLPLETFNAVPELDANGSGIVVLKTREYPIAVSASGFTFHGAGGDTATHVTAQSLGAGGPKSAKLARKFKGRAVLDLTGVAPLDSAELAPSAVSVLDVDASGNVTGGTLSALTDVQHEVTIRSGRLVPFAEGVGLMALRGGAPDTTDEVLVAVLAFVARRDGSSAAVLGYLSDLQDTGGGRFLPVRGTIAR